MDFLAVRHVLMQPHRMVPEINDSVLCDRDDRLRRARRLVGRNVLHIGPQLDLHRRSIISGDSMQ